MRLQFCGKFKRKKRRGSTLFKALLSFIKLGACSTTSVYVALSNPLKLLPECQLFLKPAFLDSVAPRAACDGCSRVVARTISGQPVHSAEPPGGEDSGRGPERMGVPGQQDEGERRRRRRWGGTEEEERERECEWADLGEENESRRKRKLHVTVK